MMERMQILTPRGRIGIGERLLLTSSWVVGWIRIVEVLWQLVHSVKLSGDDDVFKNVLDLKSPFYPTHI